MPDNINGISVSRLERYKQMIAEFPERALVDFSVGSSWHNQTKMGVDSTSCTIGDVAIKKSFNQEAGVVDEFFGSNDGPNPQELLIAAINASMMVAYVMHAAARGITLYKVEVETHGQIDLRGLLGVDPDTQPGFKSLSYVVKIRGNANRTEWESLHQEVKRTAPNYTSMLHNVHMSGELVIDET